MGALRLPARFAALTAEAAAEAAAAAVAARRHRLGLVDGEVAPAVGVTVELLDGALRALAVAHLDEREAAGLARGAVADDVDSGDLTRSFEQRLQIRLGGFVRKVPDIELGAHVLTTPASRRCGLL